MAVLIHAAVIIALVVNVSLDKPSRPDEGSGDIMHATFVPPAKGNPNGGNGSNEPAAQSAPAPAPAPEPPKAEEKAQEQVAEDLKYQIQKQKELALRKAQEEKKKLEDQKKKLEAQKQAEEQRKKAEAEAKAKAEAEAKAKAEAEAKKKAEEEARKKAEAEAKAKAEAEAKAKAEADAKAKADAAAKAKAAADAKAKAAAAANANALEDDILGTADGDPVNGKGLGSGGGDGGYGAKVRTLIEQNWRVDSSMNGKTVKVSIAVGPNGEISDESCQGDKKVCDSAINTLNLIGMLPKPPAGCKECSNIVISMTPKI